MEAAYMGEGTSVDKVRCASASTPLHVLTTHTSRSIFVHRGSRSKGQHSNPTDEDTSHNVIGDYNSG